MRCPSKKKQNFKLETSAWHAHVVYPLDRSCTFCFNQTFRNKTSNICTSNEKTVTSVNTELWAVFWQNCFHGNSDLILLTDQYLLHKSRQRGPYDDGLDVGLIDIYLWSGYTRWQSRHRWQFLNVFRLYKYREEGTDIHLGARWSYKIYIALCGWLFRS